ncbi:MAG: hypothetical protein Q9182_004549 [Xanthomendoza sp. 2 TL-2023]
MHPDDITRELSRILNQVPKTSRKGHYFLDPLRSRIRDLNCLYFPAGFYTVCGERRVRCQSIGHFVAIQFRTFVARLLLDNDGEDTTSRWTQVDPRIEFTEEHMASLTREANQWRTMKDFWIQGFLNPKPDEGVRSITRFGRDPLSAAEATEKLMVRMGYEEFYGQMYLNGQLCEAGADQGVKIQNPNRKRPLLLTAEHDLERNLDRVGNCDALPRPARQFGGYDHRRVKQEHGWTHPPGIFEGPALDGRFRGGDSGLEQDYFAADEANV